MTMTRAMLTQLEHVLRPVRRQLADVAARALVLLVDDSKKMQLVQVGVPETVPDAEHFQPYGFTSVPLPGAEGVALFPAGNRAHPLVLVVADRRYRPTGGAPGQVALHNHVGTLVLLLPDGTVEVRSDSGAASKLPTLADYEALRAAYNNHTHTVATTGSASAQTGTAAAVVSPVGAPAGTTVLKAQ